MRLLVSAVMVLIGVAGLAGATAGAQPSSPAPTPPGSTSDELADMVMDAIGHGSGAPTTTPVPPPH
ncbi:MAG: hypothetical protein QOF25_2851 [Mycobacterium sp.]|jgi:hypothetical protein|nr:hypothetical protein [Mycobacterium sp.]